MLVMYWPAFLGSTQKFAKNVTTETVTTETLPNVSVVSVLLVTTVECGSVMIFFGCDKMEWFNNINIIKALGHRSEERGVGKEC